MKDDSLNDTQQENKMALRGPQTKDGGYCPICDTVYDKPHECVDKQMSREDIKAVGQQASKLTNIESYRLKPLLAGSGNYSVLAREIWNEAIAAAAELFPYGEWEEINIAAKIRKLKK